MWFYGITLSVDKEDNWLNQYDDKGIKENVWVKNNI